MASKVLRVSEIYMSIQGEGPHVGEPTIFLRFGGCNLRCPLWPCDTQHAIDPKYRHEWARMDVEDILNVIDTIGEQWEWFNVCLTGGEPFLQPDEALHELCIALSVHPRVVQVECFSNGTLPYADWAARLISFVMDWKLPGSGEWETGREARLSNVERLAYGDSVKFTIADREDYEQAKQLYAQYVKPKGLEVFAGVVWGKLENETLVGWMLEDHIPWRLNVQVHNHVWDRSKRGI